MERINCAFTAFCEALATEGGNLFILLLLVVTGAVAVALHYVAAELLLVPALSSLFTKLRTDHGKNNPPAQVGDK